MRVVITGRCTACSFPRCTGYISFGTKLHERHCDACLRNWEKIMREAPQELSLALYRAWQAARAEVMVA